MNTRILNFSGLFILGVVLILMSACDSPSGPGGSGGGALLLSHVYPPNGALNQSRNIIISWTPVDSLTDNTAFDVYFGSQTPLSLVADSVTDTLFTPGVLAAGTTYYWKIALHGQSESATSIYRFSTGTGFTYPLKVGYQWDYDRYLICYNCEPDTLIDYLPYDDDTLLYNVRVVIDSTALLFDTLETYAFTTIDLTVPDHRKYDFMNSTADGFFSYAYAGASAVIAAPLRPMVGGSARYVFQGYEFKDLNQLTEFFASPAAASSIAKRDSIRQIEDPPVMSLKYPIVEGDQWVYRSSPWTMNKKTLAWSDITVPAGQFECMELQWLWDRDQNGYWDDNLEGYDYVSVYGLVKRFFIYHSVNAVDVGGQVQGTFDLLELYQLTNHNL